MNSKQNEFGYSGPKDTECHYRDGSITGIACPQGSHFKVKNLNVNTPGGRICPLGNSCPNQIRHFQGLVKKVVLGPQAPKKLQSESM